MLTRFPSSRALPSLLTWWKQPLLECQLQNALPYSTTSSSLLNTSPPHPVPTAPLPPVSPRPPRSWALEGWCSINICYSNELPGSGEGQSTWIPGRALPSLGSADRRLHGGAEAGRPARCPPQVSPSPLRGYTGTEPPSGGNTPDTCKTPAEAQGRRKLCGRPATGSQ